MTKVFTDTHRLDMPVLRCVLNIQYYDALTQDRGQQTTSSNTDSIRIYTLLLFLAAEGDALLPQNVCDGAHQEDATEQAEDRPEFSMCSMTLHTASFVAQTCTSTDTYPMVILSLIVLLI